MVKTARVKASTTCMVAEKRSKTSTERSKPSLRVIFEAANERGKRMTTKKVPVLEFTLIRRVNRLMAEKNCKLKKNKRTRGSRGGRTEREKTFGTYFLVKNGKAVIEHHIDLEKFARRHAVLEPYEVVLFKDEQS
jgi:hypothetical protein